jgi:hypothetical protein
MVIRLAYLLESEHVILQGRAHDLKGAVRQAGECETCNVIATALGDKRLVDIR